MLRFISLILVVLVTLSAASLRGDNMIMMQEKEWDILKAQFLQAIAANDYPTMTAALEKMKGADSAAAVETLLASYSHFYEKTRAKSIAQAPKEMLDVLLAIPQVLAVYKSDEAVQKLIAFGLKSKNLERVELAASVLKTIKPAAALEPWIELVENKKTPPGVLIDCLEGLGALADKTCAQTLLKLAEKEERSEVQAPLIVAFKNMGETRAIPHLIRFLENGSYRVKSVAKDALISLTGKNLHDNIAMWKEWWEQNKAAIEDGTFVKTETAPPEEGTPATGADFYGVKIETDRIIFVLDMSDSMKTTYPGTKKSKGDVAKEELTKAIKGLPESAYFNIVFFNAGVFVFSKNKMVKADAKTVQEAVKFIADFNFAWGTNVYGAMEKAFELAGVLKNGKPVVSTGNAVSYVDTIFFLSDGLPVGGEVEDPNQILAAIRDWNRNIRITVNSIYIQVAGANKEKQKFGLTGYQFLERMAKENQGAYTEK